MKALLLAATLLAAWPCRAQTPNPIIGNWALNLEKSQFPTAQHPRMEVRQYRERADGYLVGLAISVDAAGNPGFLQFTARSDGEFYPEYNSATLSDLVATRNPTTMDYAEKATGERLTDWTDRRNGNVTASGTKQVSADGSQLFIIVNNPNRPGQPSTYTLVYDRQ